MGSSSTHHQPVSPLLNPFVSTDEKVVRLRWGLPDQDHARLAGCPLSCFIVAKSHERGPAICQTLHLMWTGTHTHIDTHTDIRSTKRSCFVACIAFHYRCPCGALRTKYTFTAPVFIVVGTWVGPRSDLASPPLGIGCQKWRDATSGLPNLLGNTQSASRSAIRLPGHSMIGRTGSGSDPPNFVCLSLTRNRSEGPGLAANNARRLMDDGHCSLNHHSLTHYLPTYLPTYLLY